jgi:CRP-like cAMP-binding protein
MSPSAKDLDGLEGLEGRFPAITEHLSRRELEALAAALQPLTLAAGATLIEEGQSADTLYLVVDGTLRVTIDVAGKQRAVGVLEAGAIVGEVSLMDPGPASATVTGDGEVRLDALSHPALDELARREPHVGAAILRALCHVLSDRLRDADARTSAVIAAFDDGTNEKAEPEHHGLMDWFRVRFGSARR